MNLPSVPFINKNQPQDPYQIQPPQSPDSKKKLLFMIGSVILLMLLIVWIIFSGRTAPGELELRRSLQATSDALGIIDEYEKDLDYAPTKADVALTQILIRGNFQELNDCYNKTYRPGKKFNTSPKPDEESKETLDAANRNNTLDSEIIKVLRPKIASAEDALSDAKKVISGKSNKQIVEEAHIDMLAILETLDKSSAL